MKSRSMMMTVVTTVGLSLASQALAQTPGVLYTWAPAGDQNWFRNFGAANTSATIVNNAGTLEITETSATAGGSQAFSDGFNTIRDASALFGNACCGGLDLTGLSSLEFDLGHNGSGPVNVQFFTQATPGSNYLAFGPDVAVAPGMATYSLPLGGLTADQITYMRTIGINIRDHAAQGNLVWSLGEVRSVGTPLLTRVLANHDGGAADFDGAIVNFDGGGVLGNSGQNNTGLSVAGGSLEWTDLGGGPGGAITWGNGTQNNSGSFNARPVDLSNYDTATIRMAATGNEASLFVQFFMQTGSGFTYQSVNTNLTVDGQFYDLVFPLAAITNRAFTDTIGVNLGGHANDLRIQVDSVILSRVPEPTSVMLLGLGLFGCLGSGRRTRRMTGEV